MTWISFIRLLVGCCLLAGACPNAISLDITKLGIFAAVT